MRVGHRSSELPHKIAEQGGFRLTLTDDGHNLRKLVLERNRPDSFGAPSWQHVEEWQFREPRRASGIGSDNVGDLVEALTPNTPDGKMSDMVLALTLLLNGGNL